MMASSTLTPLQTADTGDAFGLPQSASACRLGPAPTNMTWIQYTELLLRHTLSNSEIMMSAVCLLSPNGWDVTLFHHSQPRQLYVVTVIGLPQGCWPVPLAPCRGDLVDHLSTRLV